MTRKIVLLLISGLFLTATSPGCGVVLECSNNLDGTTLGFTLIVPAEYVCQGSLPASPPALALLGYSDSTTDWSVFVFVTEPPTDGEQVNGGLVDGATAEELDPYTSTPNGIVFEQAKLTSSDGGFTYVIAVTTLSSGNLLAILVAVPADAATPADDAALLTLLNTIANSVAFTGA
ncbi:MAG: hypothetical protein ABII12_15315 [Planctomycetota bacterium]